MEKKGNKDEWNVLPLCKFQATYCQDDCSHLYKCLPNYYDDDLDE